MVLCQVVLALARLYLLQGHLDLCEQHCAILLQTEKNHETASMVRGPLGLFPALPGVPVNNSGCFLAPEPRCLANPSLRGCRADERLSVDLPSFRLEGGLAAEGSIHLLGQSWGGNEVDSLQGKPHPLSVKARAGWVPGVGEVHGKGPSPVLLLSSLSPIPPRATRQRRGAPFYLHCLEQAVLRHA